MLLVFSCKIDQIHLVSEKYHVGSLVFYSRTESVFYTSTLITLIFEKNKMGKGASNNFKSSS